MMKWNFYKLSLAFLCIPLGGCSSMVAEYISESKSFSFDSMISYNEIVKYGFEKDSFCSKSHKACLSYLYGKPLEKQRIRYTTDLISNVQESNVSLDIEKSSLPDIFHGTVVLLHGFRSSKEFMLNSALYFRFLGFEVLVPDLLGHGESEGRKEFGVGDSKIINELINNKYNSKQELYLLGNSMGAITAAYVSSMRDDINGLILQAPMLEFDQAVFNYVTSNHPYVSSLLSEDNIREGAKIALNRANISLDGTNIKQLINLSEVPVLIFASVSDSVAPYSDFSQLTSDHTSVVKMKNRNHPSMAVIGNDESAEFIKWFEKLKR